MANEPFVNPKTDKLRCPINAFSDCVQEQCFFWMKAPDAQSLLEAGLQLRPLSTRLRDTCQLLLLGQLVEPLLRDVDIIRLAVAGEGDAPPADLQHLRKMQEKLDLLLKRTEKP